MKKFILSIAIAIAALAANPATLRGQDLMDTATGFLKEKGIENPNLKCTKQTSNLAVYSGQYTNCYVIIAESRFSAVLGGQVLAYSTESSLNGGSDEMVYAIADRYDAMLSKVKPRRICGLRTQRLRRQIAHSRYVAPMLSNFSQGSPYNKLFPAAGGAPHAAVGCGPLALAQILFYHHFGNGAKGIGTITDSENRVYSYNLDSYKIRYDGSENDNAVLMLCSAASLDAKALDASNTQTSFENMKSALISKWGFSPACTHVKDESTGTMIKLITAELLAGRPVLVRQTNEHTYTCDGLGGGFIHLNFGWDYYCNGWFRLLALESDTQQLPFKEMMIGIEPFNASDFESLSITTQEPGTLESLLSEKQILGSLSIKVSGPINGDDIKVLRRMAGAKVDGNSSHGVLSEMDLSDAVIVGNTAYHTRPCYNMKVSGYYPDGTTYNYDMSKITDAEWAKLVANGREKNSSRLLSKGSDGVYYITFFSENNILGKYMFEDCANLIKVKLPTTLVEMRSYIFLNCRSLEKVDNMPAKCDPNALKGSALENK